MLRRMLIVGSLAVLAVAHAGSSAATELFARVQVYGEAESTAGQLYDIQQNLTISTPILLTAGVPGASALASANFGVLRLQSVAAGTAGGVNPYDRVARSPH